MSFTYSLVSDLHLDHSQPSMPELEKVVIVAGDSGDGLIGLKYLNNLKSKGHSVFAVTGNHEHYANKSRRRTVAETEAAFYKGLGNQPLVIDVDRIRLIGCNGWYCVTDPIPWAIYMNDSRLCDLSGEDVNTMAKADAEFVDEQLSKSDRLAIVVTHTAPCEASLDPKYSGSKWNEYYFNPHMTPLLKKHSHKILIWHHGHTHAAVDVTVDGVRIVTNPRGYPRENLLWKPLTLEF